MLASVVIPNFNYERFLAEAIDSALAQTHPHVEVVVVDDGSTDESRTVIERYGGGVTAIFKRNEGQRSAFNAGLARSRGELVCFLDADDVLEPTAIERAADQLADRSVSKVHWPLRGIAADGSPTGQLFPPVPLPAGDLRAKILAEGPYACASPPASGIAWARRFLDRVMPLPVPAAGGFRRHHAEAHLVGLAPLFGELRAIDEPLASYRLHGDNDYATVGFREQLERDLALYDERCESLRRHAAALGLDADPAAWRPRRDWLERLSLSLAEIERVVPPGECFAFADECQWALPALPDRPHLPFTDRDGEYWGPPADDTAAIVELDRVLSSGVRFVVVAWQAFWWLDHYPRFAEHLRAEYACRVDNERIKIFEAPRSPGRAAPTVALRAPATA